MIEIPAALIKDCEETAVLGAVHQAQHNDVLCPRPLSVAWARGTVRGYALWLSTTLGPEKAAEVLYALADEAAARVMTPASQKFLKTRKQ